ncbi:MAG: T9SS type A sorting domain-containing protein, partial [Bacteroidia bacterium]|nr:T9SS type A sorting domain-containing protein [Bacteroidia bacterium]
NSSYSTERSGTNFYNTAVTVQFNKKGTSNSNVSIYGNEINDCRIGVHANQVQNIKIGGYNTGGGALSNLIQYHLGTSVLTDKHHGIWLQNSHHADVLENTVTNDSPTSEATVRGLVIENCHIANIGCNNFVNLGRAIRFEGDCTGMPGTQLIKNNMTDYEIGIELDLAQIPNQGSQGDPWDNKWNHSYPVNHDKVSGQLLQPILIDWYFQNNDGDANNIFGPFPRGANLILPHDNQTTLYPQCVNSNLKGDFDRDARFGAVVGDSAQYEDYGSELIYAAKASVYETLKQNDSLLNLGLPSDASFQDFFNAMNTTNIGALSDVQTALDSNQIDTAAVINEAVNDTNSIEYARKSINSILSEKILKNIPMTASDTATLEYIFSQHWILAGDAVYAAAAILCKEYHSPHISLRKRHSSEPEKPKTDAEFTSISLHPKPANNKLHVTGLPEANCEIEIYDSYCRLLLKKLNAVNSLIIDLQDYSNGFYHLRIHNNYQNYRTNFVILK